VERIVDGRLDHLVWAVPDLVQGAELIGAGTGAKPSKGGSHTGIGTANYLVGLGAETYLEVIGPDTTQPPPADERPFGIDRLHAPRLATFAVHVEGIDACVEALRREGHDPGTPFALQRALPDGGTLSWKLTRPPEWADGVVPFLIDWGGSTHPSQSCTSFVALEQFAAEHPDPERVREIWRAMGLPYVVAEGPVARLEATIRGPVGSMRLTSG
jgi:hypothetical protein